jgi:hypothetical protein
MGQGAALDFCVTDSTSPCTVNRGGRYVFLSGKVPFEMFIALRIYYEVAKFSFFKCDRAVRRKSRQLLLHNWRLVWDHVVGLLLPNRSAFERPFRARLATQTAGL